jgi:hypothetical protein
MLESFLGKVVNSAVSFTSLAFSSFVGNDAVLTQPSLTQNRNHVVIESTLLHAFDNDFDVIFRSGKEIEVWFVLTVEDDKRKVFEKYFTHKVKYDPMSRSFHVVLQERDGVLDTRNYNELLQAISRFEYAWNWRVCAKPGQDVKGKISAHMRKTKLDAGHDDFNLMMLWKYRKPEVIRTCRIKPYET